MEPREYLRAFDRVNLLNSRRWDAKQARRSAGRITHRRRILLGSRVAAAHEVKFIPFRVQVLYDINVDGKPYVRILVLPHPSGRCRVWNDPAAAVRARVAVERFLKETA